MQKRNKIVKYVSRLLFTIVKDVKYFLYLPTFLCLYRRYGLQHHAEEKKSILFVNNMSLGDVLICIELLSKVEKSGRFNNCYLIVKEEIAEIFNSIDINIKIISLNNRKYKSDLNYRFRFLNYVNILGISHAINLSQERGIVNDELTLLCGAEKKYCLESQDYYISKKYLRRTARYYSRIIHSPETNEYKKLSYFYSLLGLEYKDERISFITDKAVESVVLQFNKYIVMAPIASEANKSWAMNNYKLLAKELSKRYKIILLGTEDQKVKIEDISDGLRIINLAGTTKLSQLPTVLSGSMLYIGNDSGLTHLALLCNMPVIAIIGGGSFGRFLPAKENEKTAYIYRKMDCFGCRWNCEYEESVCISQITVDEVVRKADFLLKEIYHNTK